MVGLPKGKALRSAMRNATLPLRAIALARSGFAAFTATGAIAHGKGSVCRFWRLREALRQPAECFTLAFLFVWGGLIV
jgi:hypothetical protein